MYCLEDNPNEWVLPKVLDEVARNRADKIWIKTTEGEQITFGEMSIQARQVASYFQDLGVKPGDHVAIWKTNSIDLIRSWLGLGYLGAVAVMINTELSGTFLSHQLNDSSASLVVTESRFIPEITKVKDALVNLEKIVFIDSDEKNTNAKYQQYIWSDWKKHEPYIGDLPSSNQIACIMYTSGTSGPAKGVLMPHAHCTLYGFGSIQSLELTEDDVYYTPLPLFHANALFMQLGATLIRGMTVVLRSRFSASQWAKDIYKHNVTVTNLLGALSAFILVQPESDTDSKLNLRAIMSAPNAPEHDKAFKTRFGVKDIVSGFGMTECNIPTWGRINDTESNHSGYVYSKYFEVAIVDPETDLPVPYGSFGEIVVRPKVASGFMAGYHNLPEQTVEAWRNLWFHTGDAGKITEDGILTYIDRIKDCIRSRGENISALQIEQAVQDITGVIDVAAYGVPSDILGGEDDVMMALVLEPEIKANFESLKAQIENNLPRYAQPKHYRIMDAMPKTATGRIQKALLKEEGVV